jgi:hypothetical protein
MGEYTQQDMKRAKHLVEDAIRLVGIQSVLRAAGLFFFARQRSRRLQISSAEPCPSRDLGEHCKIAAGA